ncbi:MAG: sugar ABC transporter ATP-binding protein [Anaerolineae bacterium]|nr:sugar ABC transporter ATP-binding protein [Anaerolineae bacterium]
MAESNNKDMIVLEGISKSFPGVQALDDVAFTLKRGEIHCLMGGNGAGKSTLIKIITGVERQDTGTVLFDGQEVSIKSPQQAQMIGISPVYQEINLCTNLSVAENILIGREPRKFGAIAWKAMNNRASQQLQRLNINIDVTEPLGVYSTAIQQMVAIARALEVAETKVLILDEPTSSLDVHETEKLFEVMRKLRDEGIAIIFITHFLNQVYEISDRMTILRNGKLVGTYDTESLPMIDLVAKMIGRSLSDFSNMTQIKRASKKNIKEDTLLQAEQLGRSKSIQPFDLELHAGEVVGLAGLLGSGRTEIANLLFGVDKPDNGTLRFKGEAIKKFSPNESIARGIGFCPEDRKAEGLVGELTVRENIILAIQANQGWFKFLSKQKQYELAERYIKLLDIKTSTADQMVKNLSGGNQQKVILARWLAINPQVLILDEPTRGVDIGAKTEIQRLVLELAEEGKSCVFISSELEEVLRTSHRIVVLRDREKINEFGSGEADEHKIMEAIAAGDS